MIALGFGYTADVAELAKQSIELARDIHTDEDVAPAAREAALQALTELAVTLKKLEDVMALALAGSNPETDQALAAING